MATFFERWKFADYFELLKQRKKNINAKCEVCPGNKHFSSHLSNTNLRLVTAKDAWTQPSSQALFCRKNINKSGDRQACSSVYCGENVTCFFSGITVFPRHAHIHNSRWTPNIRQKNISKLHSVLPKWTLILKKKNI